MTAEKLASIRRDVYKVESEMYRDRGAEVAIGFIAAAAKRTTLADLARKSGVSRGAIQGYVHRRHKPSAQAFLAILAAVGGTEEQIAAICYEIAQAMGDLS